MKDTMNFRYQVFVIALVVWLTSCASPPSSVTYDIELTQDAQVQIGQQAPMKMKKGATVKGAKLPAYIEAPGYVSLVTVPLNQTNKKLKISLTPLTNWENSLLQKKTNALLNQLLPRITEAQRLLAKKKFEDALEKVKALEETYPEISYLKLLKASCLVVLNRKAEAKTELVKALVDFPDNKEARQFYENLGGTLEELKAEPTH